MAPEALVDTVAWTAPGSWRRSHASGPVHARREIDFLDRSVTSCADVMTLPSGIRLTVHTQSGLVYFEGSPPKAMQSHNVTGLTWAATVEAMRQVEFDAGEVVKLSGDVSSRRLRRVDLVRDFQPVARAGVLIERLAA